MIAMEETKQFKELPPVVLQAVPVTGYKVHAYMNDGTIHLFDAWPMILSGEVFEPLKNSRVFADSLTVINETVAWDLSGDRDPGKCIDVDPYTIMESPIVNDPSL